MNVSAKILGLCVLALAAGSCNKGKEATAEPAVRVKTMPVESTRLTTGRTYSGTVQESGGTTLSFAALGTIQSLNVNVGDRVSKGQLIGTLDNANLRHAYDITQATLNQAQDAYNRMKMLHDANALPDIKWVEAQNALSSAQSAAAIAKKELGDANLYASQSGYVAEKVADVGMNVGPGIPVVRIVDINPVKVSVSVPENEIASIGSAAQAAITVGALQGKAFTGKISEKGVTANPLSRSYDVKFEVANPNGELLPGMICDVAMTADSARTVTVVPADAVLLDANNQNFVWLAKDGQAAKQVVTVEGMTAGTRLIIGSGLAVGDSVIVAGQQKVSNGSHIVSNL